MNILIVQLMLLYEIEEKKIYMKKSNKTVPLKKQNQLNMLMSFQIMRNCQEPLGYNTVIPKSP